MFVRVICLNDLIIWNNKKEICQIDALPCRQAQKDSLVIASDGGCVRALPNEFPFQRLPMRRREFLPLNRIKMNPNPAVLCAPAKHLLGCCK